jgi:hypothetical protein
MRARTLKTSPTPNYTIYIRNDLDNPNTFFSPFHIWNDLNTDKPNTLSSPLKKRKTVLVEYPTECPILTLLQLNPYSEPLHFVHMEMMSPFREYHSDRRQVVSTIWSENCMHKIQIGLFQVMQRRLSIFSTP